MIFAESIAQLRSAFFADPKTAHSLLALWAQDRFAARLLEVAEAKGIAIDPAALDRAQLSPPLCLPNFAAADGALWPPRGWLPTALNRFAAEPIVEFALTEGLSLCPSFFEELRQTANSRPFNRLLRYRMRLADVVAAAPAGPPPAGFIFHLSRCGSTLAHRMLAASGSVQSFSEAAPFDDALQFCLGWDGPDSVKHNILRAMAAAFSNGSQPAPVVFKLDAWHIASWRLLRAAFPETAFVFLYREPLEVMVSQQRMRGFQMVPQPGFAASLGIEDFETLSLDDYAARFLARSCELAAEAVRAGEMIAINYRALPDAVITRILPHFALTLGPEEGGRMRHAAGYNSKNPEDRHRPDGQAKQQEADETLRELCERVIAPSYRRLEALAGAIDTSRSAFSPTTPRAKA